VIGAALIASLLWGTADFLGGQASRKNPAAMVALVATIGATMLIVPTASAR